MKALIHGSRIAQVSENEFPVASPLRWVVVPDDTTTRDEYINGSVLKYVEPSTPPLTAADVRAEAQRRIIALVGATSFDGCIIKQLNANMRANELNDIRHGQEWTAEEAAEAAALRGLANQIKAIRAASNVLEPSPPSDFADNKYWP
jgi:hypothetical protein